MTVVSIPYDILGNVFVYLDRLALLSVCLANKLFNLAAIRLLYGREIILDPWNSKWSISPKYAPMIRTVIWTGVNSTSVSEKRLTLIQKPFPHLPGLRAFRWFGMSTIAPHRLIKLFVHLTKIETLQEITLQPLHWNALGNSDEWKEALDCSRVVQLGGLPLNLLNQLSARVLQRLTSIKDPVSRLNADTCERLLMITRLRDLACEPPYDLVDGTKVLETIGRLQKLQSLSIALHYWTSGGDMTPFDAFLPHLKHFTFIVRRRPGTSTKNAAYIVKTLTADATLETLDVQCDFKGWDTSTIYRAIKRHSKTLQILCAPGWYAHTSMLQALDEFSMLEVVTIGRIVHLEVNVLRDFKRIQVIYLYNHQHAPPLPTSEVKMLLLQSESTIHTFGETPYTDKEGRATNVWRAHWTYDSILERPRRNLVRCTQTALGCMVL